MPSPLMGFWMRDNQMLPPAPAANVASDLGSRGLHGSMASAHALPDATNHASTQEPHRCAVKPCSVLKHERR